MTPTSTLPARPVRRRAPAPPLLTDVMYPVVLLRPPYDPAGLRAAPSDLSAVAEVPGTVVGVQLTRPVLDPASLRYALADLARRAPACPVVVLLDLPPEQALSTMARLAPLNLRAVAPLDASLPSLLQTVLTDPATMPAGVVAWLRACAVRLNPNQADLLERLLAASPAHADMGSLLEDLHIPQSSARFRLRKRGLPAPARWFHLARTLHAALLLQADSAVPLAHVAAQLGFADHSALVHLLRRCCGVCTSEVRGTLGWEWLLSRWWTARRSSRR